jgi:hypothetical protein
MTISQVGSGTQRTRRGFRRRRTYYYPVVQYRYRVDGRDFLGERITSDSVRVLGARSDERSRNRGLVQRILARYPEGAAVRVYYDPDDPNRSVLEPGVTRGAQLKAALGSLLFVAGGALLIYKIRSH